METTRGIHTEEGYNRCRIYTTQYDVQMGWENFVIVFPKSLEPDSYKATRLGVSFAWDFSIFDGRNEHQYFNGEHDFDVSDLIYDYGDNWIVILEDVGS